LKSKLRSFEEGPSTELQQWRQRSNSLPSPPLTNNQSSTCSLAEKQGDGSVSEVQKLWEGIWLKGLNENNTQYYGPSSGNAFVGRMASFLSSVLAQDVNIQSLCPTTNVAWSVTESPNNPGFSGFPKRQEEGFLNLFWQTYHCLIPVVCKEDLKSEFKLLWSIIPNGGFRQRSSLIDIVLALCIQFGRCFIQGPSDVIDDQDTIYTSVWYYRRCQAALLEKWESPSITSVQCYLLSVVYLQNGVFMNIAYSTLGVAIRMGQTLGLHLESPNSVSLRDRELRKRIWWSLYMLDTNLSIELGRPFAIQLSEASLPLPVEDEEFTQLIGCELTLKSADITWLSFSVQSIKLVETIRRIYISFYSQSEEILSSSKGHNIYEHAQSLERCAELLSRCMEPLSCWTNSLPDGLKIRRKNSGIPLSADRTSIDIDANAPLWLQLQRLSLELLYHNLVSTLYRQFIYFTPHSTTTTPLSDMHATSALNHAITVTNIIKTVLTDMDIFNAWYPSFNIQWHASLTVIAFALAYPICPPAPAARKASATSISTFEFFGFKCPTATEKATVLRDLDSKSRWLMFQFRRSVDNSPPQPSQRSQPKQAGASGQTSGLKNTIQNTNSASVTDSAMPLENGGVDGLYWPEMDDCNIEMWMSFLNDLESAGSSSMGN
jgi:hypothetical protein